MTYWTIFFVFPLVDSYEKEFYFRAIYNAYFELGLN